MAGPLPCLHGFKGPDFGQPSPFFAAATDGIQNYHLDVAAGRWIVLQMFGSLGSSDGCEAHALAVSRRALFNDIDAAYFGVSVDPADRAKRSLTNSMPGLRYFWDFDKAVCRLYGLVAGDVLTPHIFLLDRTLRIVEHGPIEQTARVLDRLEAELVSEREQSMPFAPVLQLPRIFEPDLCRRLMAYFDAAGGTQSGFAIDIEGRTMNIVHAQLKRRHDVEIEDEAMCTELRDAMTNRLLPMVQRAFAWRGDEIERYLVCRYGEAERGFFSAHRDNATIGTAHRQFAVTINLNAGEYEGGDLYFPEYGDGLYRPPTGGAVVFSCSLLHAVKPVTRGARYAFVPFLFAESGAKHRKAHQARNSQGQGPQPNRAERRRQSALAR